MQHTRAGLLRFLFTSYSLSLTLKHHFRTVYKRHGGGLTKQNESNALEAATVLATCIKRYACRIF